MNPKKLVHEALNSLSVVQLNLEQVRDNDSSTVKNLGALLHTFEGLKQAEAGAMKLKKPKLDAKFFGHIYKAKDCSEVPDDEYVVFLAKDDAFLPTLQFYHEECERLGAGPRQLAAIDAMIVRLKQWREANPTLCKVPGIEEDERLLVEGGYDKSGANGHRDQEERCTGTGDD